MLIRDRCMCFEAVVSFDYGQEIEEQFAITVSAPNSIAAVGTLKDRLSGALVGEYPPIIAVESALTLYKNEIIGIPPTDLATPSAGFTTAANVTLTPETDRSAANAAMQDVYKRQSKPTSKSARKNKTTWSPASISRLPTCKAKPPPSR